MTPMPAPALGMFLVDLSAALSISFRNADTEGDQTIRVETDLFTVEDGEFALTKHVCMYTVICAQATFMDQGASRFHGIGSACKGGNSMVSGLLGRERI